MSRTDNTRPIHVIEADASVTRIETRPIPVYLTGGAGSMAFGRRSKLVRKQDTKSIRRRVKTSLQNARKLIVADIDTVDIAPMSSHGVVSWRRAF